MSKKTYEDMSSVIDNELDKRKGSWFLKALPWMDYDDVSQIIRAHIYKKWEQWDQSKPLEPWINRIITHQIKNILRDKYGNFTRPCLRCDFRQGGEGMHGGDIVELCGFTESKKQCNECPLYAKWEKTKKHAFNIKIPVSSSWHEQEIYDMPSDFDISEGMEDRLHMAMKKELTERQYFAYEEIFIKGTNEEEVAEKMGFYSNEKSRKAGYRQIRNLKILFKETAEKILRTQDIVIYPDNHGKKK